MFFNFHIFFNPRFSFCYWFIVILRYDWQAYLVWFQSFSTYWFLFYGQTHGLLWRMFYVLLRRMFILLFLGGVLYNVIRSSGLTFLFKSSTFLLTYYWLNSLFEEQYSTIFVGLSISSFNIVTVFFLYTVVQLLSAYIFIIVLSIITDSFFFIIVKCSFLDLEIFYVLKSVLADISIVTPAFLLLLFACI